jgi:hypothetical protein
MSAIIVNLEQIRHRHAEEAERRREEELRQDVSDFNESLHAAMERFRFNPQMIATLLMAKVFDALSEARPHACSENEEYLAGAELMQSIVKARAKARERARQDAVRILKLPTSV